MLKKKKAKFSYFSVWSNSDYKVSYCINGKNASEGENLFSKGMCKQQKIIWNYDELQQMNTIISKKKAPNTENLWLSLFL